MSIERFKDAPWFSPEGQIEVIIGGAGGIGSWLALFLSRQRVSISIFDMDTIESVNLAGQFYCAENIGATKVEALSEWCSVFSDWPLDTNLEYTKDSPTHKYVFSCFDNMSARKLMFEKWAEKATDDSVFIDGRLLAEEGSIYCVTKAKIEEYRKTLFDDAEVLLVSCSYKATSHCSALIASLMTSCFNNYITNVKAGMELREVTFNINFQLPVLNFEQKNES